MSFFMVGDEFHSHLKVVELLDQGQVGLAAIGLWTVCGSQSQFQGADGMVSESAARRLVGAGNYNKLAKILVEVGLWEDRPDGKPGHQFHDWFDIGYTPAAKVKLNRKRTKEMKNPDIINAIKARDCNKCRYCGRTVKWSDKHSDAGGTYDHVIPGMAKGVANLVVSCRGCNRKKGQRTPEQADMKLLSPPAGPDASQPTGGNSRTRDFSPQTKEDFGPESRAIEQRSATPQRNRSGIGLDQGSKEGEAPEVGPAGRTPEIEESPGHTGSPYYHWTGPPPDVDQPTCPEHGLDMPCRKCSATHYLGTGNEHGA